MIHPLFIVACVLLAALLVYLVYISTKEKRSLRNIEQTTWYSCMEYGWEHGKIKSNVNLPTLVSKYYDKDTNRYYFSSSDYSSSRDRRWFEIVGRVHGAYLGDMWFANKVWKGNMKSKYPDLYFREVSESYRDIINIKVSFNQVVVKQENTDDSESVTRDTTIKYIHYSEKYHNVIELYDGTVWVLKNYDKFIDIDLQLVGNPDLARKIWFGDFETDMFKCIHFEKIYGYTIHDIIDCTFKHSDQLNIDVTFDKSTSTTPPKYPNGSTDPIGISKHSLLVKLFGSDYKKSESWVKWYNNGDVYSNELLDIYICSNGDMVNVKHKEPNNSNGKSTFGCKGKFYFDLVKEGDLDNGIITNDLLTVEKDFDKLTHIVDAIMKGEFKPSNSPYDKYWLELERVKVNGIVSDHQKVKDFFDKLDQRWYEYSVMYNDAMGGVIGFTPYDSKLVVGSGDELQKTIEKMKLNNSLMSLLSEVKDDDIIKSIVLDRYDVEVSVDRSNI